MTAPGWARLYATGVVAAAVLALSLVLSGCVSTVAGVASRAPDEPRWEPMLIEADLDGLLLGVDDLNDIVGSSDLQVSFDSSTLNDNSEAVSDRDCLAAAFGAQELVYQDSGWTAVRDQIVREPGEGNPHWIEQVVVLHSTAEQAQAFVKHSQAIWEGCAGTIVTFDSEDMPQIWSVSDVTADDSSISQMSTPEDSPSGGCHHVLSAASNVVVEAWVCGDDIDQQATEVVREIVAHVRSK